MDTKTDVTIPRIYKKLGTELALANPDQSKEALEQLTFYLNLKIGLATEPEKLQIIEPTLIDIESFFKNTIRNLSIEELQSIRVNNQAPMLVWLAQYGVEDLFYTAFAKLKSNLSMAELQEIVISLTDSYTGTNQLIENLNLASSLLQRGDSCFIRMLNFTLEFVMKQNRLAELFKHKLHGDQSLQEELNSLQKPDAVKCTEEDYIRQRTYGRNNISPERAKKEYQHYVTDAKGQNLALNSLSNHIQVQIIVDELMQFNDLGLHFRKQKSISLCCVIKERQAQLNPEAKAILKSVLDHKINQSQKLDCLKGQDLPINLNHDEAQQGRFSIQQKLAGVFFDSYDAKLKEDQAAWCGLYGLFARSKVNHSMSLQELVRHAQSYSNRSQEVMKKLKWLDENNQLSEDIQRFVNN